MFREALDLVCGEGNLVDCQKAGLNESDII